MTHDLVHKTDPDGRKAVGVSLTNHAERAWLFLDDYERILAEVGETGWFANHNGQGSWYVRLKGGQTGNNRQVARLVFGDFIGTGLRYKDRNPFNLRKTNLMMGEGSGGTRHKRRWYPNEATARKFGLTSRA